MSIFMKFKSIFLQKRMLFILTVICCQILFSPMICYAETDSETVENTEEESTTEEVSVNSVVFSQNIFHKHTGSSDGGGCYTTKKTGTKKKEVKCGGSLVYMAELGTSVCSNCAASYTGNFAGRECWHSEEKTVSYTYYELGCGKSSDTQIGKLVVTQSTTEWVKSLTLTGSYETTGEMKVSSKPYIWNGDSATENNTYEVTSSGTYTLCLNADENSNTAAAVVSVDIRNVDVTAPVIRAHTQEPMSDWTKEGIMVTITETVDLQPDGSEGCGLHEKAYSYDNGETWTEEATHLYMENGTHNVLVRDKLENTSSYAVSFQNVDCTPPAIQALEYDHTKNIRSTVITITAADLQPDGSEGCGLHEVPYSFDGGKTWTAENIYNINQNRTLKILVRDKLENTVSVEEKITNIDCMGPTIQYKLKPDKWTNQDVTLYLTAEDINEDGSKGSGLVDTWYSLDGGKNWTNKPELVFEKNTKLTVIARDRNDNRTTLPIKIKNIDKEQPWVSLKMEILSEGSEKQVKLQAYAGDDYSGLPENAYSWDKGASYSDKSSMIVTENGTYQVTVRDKAGNTNYEQIEVDIFPELFPILPLIPEETKPIELETMEEETDIVEEVETEVTDVIMEEFVEAPEEIPVKTLEEDFIWERVLGFFFLILGIGLLMLLAFWIWSRTIAVYAEDASGTMQYIGRLWIQHRDEQYMVDITESIIDKCMTMHLLFKPSILFAGLHKDEEMYFLFPESICVTLTIERKMEME